MKVAIASLAVGFVVFASVIGFGDAAALSVDDDRVQVVATTDILADLVRNVGGDRVNVTTLVPTGADPHSYEPSLRDVRNVVYADAAFSNYMLLEQHSIIRVLDANMAAGAPNVSLAEGAVKYAAKLIPLVEDLSLDTIWLGLRVRGGGAEFGADRNSQVRIKATGLDGPGELVAYLTESFGRPDRYFDSTDGFDASTGYRDDELALPLDAHTHMSWAFTKAGIYHLDLSAELSVNADDRPVQLATATITFAVGVDAASARGSGDVVVDGAVLDGGHSDITVDLSAGRFVIAHDPDGTGGDRTNHDPTATVIEVPNHSYDEVPSDPAFRFLGRPGDSVFQLPQAVLGKHVHGEIDPHLWHDVGNVIAYVQLIRDTLVGIDPAGALEYRDATQRYIERLDALDLEVQSTIDEIPPERRRLVTTHDAFGYLANAYGLSVSGFVTPNAASEPSLAARRRLLETITNLDIPAVFVERSLESRSPTLRAVANEAGVEVCRLYSDAFDDEVRTYIDLMRFNAASLRSCLHP